nr:hypothetical protein [Nocardia brasiliensis]
MTWVIGLACAIASGMSDGQPPSHGENDSSPSSIEAISVIGYHAATALTRGFVKAAVRTR